MVKQRNINFNKNDLGIGILASEKSRRMNTNKAFLLFGKQTFIDRLCEEFSNFGQIYISAGNKNTYKDSIFNVCQDEHEGVGPMEGIYQILKLSKHKYNFICSVDMPFLKSELVDELINRIDENHDCFVFQDEKRIHPTCAIYSKSIILLVENLIYDKKYCLLEIFDNCKTKYVDYNDTNLDKKLLTNINTRQDYEKLCK